MGGGTAMKAVAAWKIAGLGVNGGLRGAAPAAEPVEQAVRKSSIPVSAILSSSSSASADVAPVQRPERELEGWKFAGGEDDLIMVAGEPMPRVVFAGVPSVDEAMEATVELILKEALDKELATCDQLALISKPKSEINSPLVVGTAPNSALKAFQLLCTNTQVQNVVASIASDQNVLHAVMQNHVLRECMKSDQKSFLRLPKSLTWRPEKSEGSSDSSKARQSGNWFTGMLGNIKLRAVEQNAVTSIVSDQNVLHAVMQNPVLQELMKSDQKIAELFEEPVPEKSEDSSNSSKARQFGKWCMGMLGNIKLSVVELVSSLSSKVQNPFNFPSDAKDDANMSHGIGTGASLIGLVMMVVMFVLLKRV